MVRQGEKRDVWRTRLRSFQDPTTTTSRQLRLLDIPALSSCDGRTGYTHGNLFQGVLCFDILTRFFLFSFFHRIKTDCFLRFQFTLRRSHLAVGGTSGCDFAMACFALLMASFLWLPVTFLGQIGCNIDCWFNTNLPAFTRHNAPSHAVPLLSSSQSFTTTPHLLIHPTLRTTIVQDMRLAESALSDTVQLGS